MPVTPNDVADDCMQRARGLLTLAKGGSVPAAVSDDLTRLALVMGVAALDAFMHAVVLRSAARANIPKTLGKLDVTFGTLARVADLAVSAQRNGKKIRPWVSAKRALQERLLRETFQSYDAVGNAMAMAGVEKGWTKVAAEIGWTTTQIKDWLGAVVHRRNRIVHEGDLRRSLRPRKIAHSPIRVSAVEQDLDAMDELLAGLQKVLL